jgi:hypothetical protein
MARKRTTPAERPPTVELTDDEKQMVEMSLRTVPPDCRTRALADVLATTLRVPELARRLEADPRRYFEDCGIDVPPDVLIQVHRYTPDRIHLVLPGPELLALQETRGKVEITDADLVSGRAFTRMKSDTKGPDLKDGKARPDSDDKSDAVWWSDNDKEDDKGDGAQDIGDRRRRRRDGD